METSLGPIFKLNRSETNFKIRQLSEVLSIPKSKISEFENGKRELPEILIQKLYNCLGINDYPKTNSYSYLADLITSLFDCIYHGNSNNQKTYDILQSQHNKIRSSYLYVTWILGDFIYNVYNRDIFYDYEKKIKILRQYINYLEPKFVQIMYDTFGVWYMNNGNYKEAIECFDKGIQNNISNSALGLIFYHKSMILVDRGQLSDAIMVIQKAKIVFDSQLNFLRSIMCTMELGIIQTQLGHYENADTLFKECINATNCIKYDHLIDIYDNLIWNYLLWQKYDEVFYYSERALQIDNTYPNIYFYLTYACWKTEQHVLMKQHKSKMQIFENNTTDYNQLIFSAFSTYTTNRHIDVKERKLLRAYDATMKKNKVCQVLLILELLATLFKHENNLKKEIYYKDLMIKLYKKYR